MFPYQNVRYLSFVRFYRYKKSPWTTLLNMRTCKLIRAILFGSWARQHVKLHSSLIQFPLIAKRLTKGFRVAGLFRTTYIGTFHYLLGNGALFTWSTRIRIAYIGLQMLDCHNVSMSQESVKTFNMFFINILFYLVFVDCVYRRK